MGFKRGQGHHFFGIRPYTTLSKLNITTQFLIKKYKFCQYFVNFPIILSANVLIEFLKSGNPKYRQSTAIGFGSGLKVLNSAKFSLFG